MDTSTSTSSSSATSGSDRLNWNNNNRQFDNRLTSSLSGGASPSTSSMCDVTATSSRTDTSYQDNVFIASDDNACKRGVNVDDMTLVPYDDNANDAVNDNSVTSSSSSAANCHEIALLLATNNELDVTTSVADNSNQLAVYQRPLKTGDVERERLVEERVKQLGLWHNKRILERCLRQRLSDDIDADGLFQAVNRCKRRRPLRDRVESTSHEIVNTIQPQLLRDDFGNKLSYKIDVIMGIYTHSVCHKVRDHIVVIQGRTPQHRHANLHKEVTIEFPCSIDMSLLDVSFNAGVFRCEAPFKTLYANQLTNKSFDSMSAISEETESVTSSDMKSVSDVC